MSYSEINQTVVFKKEAHTKLLSGASILADAVRSTMGPSGHSVIIDSMQGPPLITKDGVTVARSINLKDRLESMGAELLKEVASKTNELAGDGTSTATVLAHAMLAKGIQMISTGRSSIYIKKGMDVATEEVLEFLKRNSIPVSGRQDIVNVGSISANGDIELGELIADAIEKVGKDGIITIEPAKSVQTSLTVVEGMQIESGFVSPFFITNSDKANCEFENPYVLITSNKISSLSELIPSLEIIAESNRPLLIVADDVEGEALHTLIVNKTKGVINVCAVKAPSYGEHRADILSDLGIVVGGEVIGSTSATSLKSVDKSLFGTCAKVIVTRNNCTFVGDPANKERKEKIHERVDSLRNVLSSDATLDDLRINKYRSRLARLSGGVAVIRVGGSTEVEIMERKDRVEDAVNATMAATQEGIVSGGGTALFYAAQYLKDLIKEGEYENQSEDFIAGVQVIVNTCESPLRTIIDNTGMSPDVIAMQLTSKYIESANPRKLTVEMGSGETKEVEWRPPETFSIQQLFRYGFNAATGEFVNLVSEGIIDPIKVTRHALKHANSVVGLMLTCNAVVVNELPDQIK